MQRTLTVDGHGKLSLVPDHVSFVFEPLFRGKSTEEASDALALHSKQLIHHLLELGIPKEEIKSFNLQVKPFIEYNKKTETYQTNGYTANQTLTIKVAREKKLIAAILDTTKHHLSTIPFRFHFVLADEKLYMRQLIEQAVNDARTKAEILADSAGVRLGAILSINYTKNTEELIYAAAARSTAEDDNLLDAWDDEDFQPEEMELDTEVTLVWELKDASIPTGDSAL